MSQVLLNQAKGIDKLLENEKKIKLPLNILNGIFTKAPLFFFLIIPTALVSHFIYRRFVEGKDFSWELLGLLIISISFLLLIVLYGFRRINLKSIGTIDQSKSEKIIFEVCKNLNWYLEKKEENLYVAHVPSSMWSWGEYIFIYIHKDLVFIKSRGQFNPITFGKNKRNIKSFKKAFEDYVVCDQGKELNERAFNQW